MKRLLSFVAILVIVFASNCTRIPENNDPVIGIWTFTELQNISATQKEQIRKEWIFNDAYLGRFHVYEGSTLSFKTDYQWEQQDGVYTISYPGTDMASDVVRMKDDTQGTVLEDEKGNILAKRE